MIKILAIDNKKDNLSTIKAMIKSHLPDCLVLTALTGRTGIKMAQKEQPDTILLDIVMPQMDGYKICKILKAGESTKHIPVIMVTDKTDMESRIKKLDLGADSFLPKPIDPIELITEIKVMLRIKEAKYLLRNDNKTPCRKIKGKLDEFTEQEKYYRLIAENTSDNIGVTTFDLKAKYLYVSPSVKTLLNYDPEDLIGKSFFDFIHPEDKKPLFSMLKHYFNLKIKKLLHGKAASITETIEYRFKSKDGEWRLLQSTINIAGKNLLSVTRDISEQKKNEIALKKSEQDFRGLFENAHDAIIIFEPKNEIVLDVNQHACEIYGFKRDEFIGMSMLSISHDPKKGKKYINQTLKKGFFGNYETIQFKKDGSPIFLEINASVVEFKGEKAILSNNRDISIRKQLEETLTSRERTYRTLINNLPGFSYRCKNDTNWTMKYISSGCEEITGYAPEDFINNKQIAYNDIIAPDYQQKIWDIWQPILKAKENFEYEYPITTKEGQIKWVWERGCGIYSEKGELEFIDGFITDVTERKRTEQIQQILYNISDAVITTDNTESFIKIIRNELGKIIDTTNFFIAFYDKNTDTFHSPFFSDEIDDYDTWPAGNTFSAYVVKTEKSLLISEEDVLKMKAEGKIEIVGKIPKIGMIVPLKYEGSTTGVFAIQSYTNKNAYTKTDLEMLEFVSDQVSIAIHRKNAEQELKDALKKATESDRLKSTFLATMSHELRTPLNAIIGFSDIIDNSLTMDEIIHFAQSINTSGNHLLTIVEDLFDITLIESGQIKIVKEIIQLTPLLHNIHDIIKIEKNKANKENIDLILEIPTNVDDLTLYTDRSKFKQILINLLKNAIRFTAEGQVNYGFEIVKDQNFPYLKFYVKDTGVGIRKDQQALIFEIFRQADEIYTNAHGGTGIGLSITKKLTEHLGGTIWLESEIGKGSIFYFTIPFDTSPEHDKNDTVKPTDKIMFETKTILIVEDIESSYQLIEAILHKFKMNLLWAKNGEEAVTFCKENPEIDLVLMDINLPIMNGYDATKAIKQFRPNLPIIAQTAYAITGDREKSSEAGCDDYISKPIRRDKLLSIIEKHLKY